MKIISIGDLVTDYYYKNGKLIGINGGMTSHNIIANIAKMKFNTAVYGVCGDDMAGNIAIKSLNDIGVNTENIKKIKNLDTRCFHVSYFESDGDWKFDSKKRCPICNEKKWYEPSKIDPDKIIRNIKQEDTLIFDNLNIMNQKIIDNTQNRKMLDLGQYSELDNYSNKEIINKLLNKFDIINLNERVEKYLKRRFNLKDLKDIYKMLKPNLIIVTRGKKGSDFVYKDLKITKNLESPAKEKDSTGAGDAFFSVFIVEYIKNKFVINDGFIENTFKKATKLTKQVVKSFGARSHITPLYKIKKINNYCTCKNFEIAIRKQVTRCSLNVNNLKPRVLNAIQSNAYDKLKQIDFLGLNSVLFVGTGGSFPASIFASRVINHIYGTNAFSILPRDILSRNNNKVDKVFLLSYSGTTNDLLEGTKEINNKNKIIITKGQPDKVSAKTNIPKENIITYRTRNNKSKERGFLSFEGTLSPASLFLKLYFDSQKLMSIDKFIKDSLDYWNNYFNNYFYNNKKELRKILTKGKVLNVFTGDYTITASKYIESTLIESGIFNILIHEKKNFSHGRFVNYENLSLKTNIYLKTKTTTKYEKVLLDYLRDDKNIIIESKYDGLLGEYDLLIAMQYLIYNIGKLLNIDLSKPNYTEKALKIYFYKGEL